MLHIDFKHLHIIQAILKEYPYTFYAFGSRVKGDPKRFSDLDLCYKEDIPSHHLVELEEAFEESYLPFKVELINWHNCSKDFQKLIEKDLVKISK